MPFGVNTASQPTFSSAPVHLSYSPFVERLAGVNNSVEQFEAPAVVVTNPSLTTRDGRAEVWRQAGNAIFGPDQTDQLVNLALFGDAAGKKLHALKLLNLALASSYVDSTVEPDEMAQAKTGLAKLANKLLTRDAGKVIIVGLDLDRSKHGKQAGNIEQFLNNCVQGDRVSIFAKAAAKLGEMLPAGFKAGFENHYGVNLTPESVAQISMQGHASTTATAHAFDRIQNAKDRGDLVAYIEASLEQLDLYRTAIPDAALPPDQNNAPPAPNGPRVPGVRVNGTPHAPYAIATGGTGGSVTVTGGGSVVEGKAAEINAKTLQMTVQHMIGNEHALQAKYDAAIAELLRKVSNPESSHMRTVVTAPDPIILPNPEQSLQPVGTQPAIGAPAEGLPETVVDPVDSVSSSQADDSNNIPLSLPRPPLLRSVSVPEFSTTPSPQQQRRLSVPLPPPAPPLPSLSTMGAPVSVQPVQTEAAQPDTSTRLIHVSKNNGEDFRYTPSNAGKLGTTLRGGDSLTAWTTHINNIVITIQTNSGSKSLTELVKKALTRGWDPTIEANKNAECLEQFGFDNGQLLVAHYDKIVDARTGFPRFAKDLLHLSKMKKDADLTLEWSSAKGVHIPPNAELQTRSGAPS